MTRRGIRELSHKRVLFGDLQYTPDQNPYSPQGIRKMEDTWVYPSGDGYVSVFPGFETVVSFDGDTTQAQTNRALMASVRAISSTGEERHLTLVLLRALDASETIVETVNSDETLTKIHTFTPALDLFVGSELGGTIPWYAVENDAAILTGDTGATNLGFLLDVDDNSTSSFGLTRPDVSSSSSAAGVGDGTAVKGVVKYFISYSGQDGTDEGPLSLEFGEIDAGDGDDVDLSNLPTKDTNKRRLYRTFKDGDQPFYLATLNSSDPTYTDNIADVDLGDLPLKMGDPPNEDDGYISATNHFGRGYILGRVDDGGRVYFTDPEEVQSFYTSEFGNWFSVDDGYSKRGLSRIPAGLILFGSHSSYILSGRTPADFTLQELTATNDGSMSVGCANHGSHVNTPHGVFFYDGISGSVYRISPSGQMENISSPCLDEPVNSLCIHRLEPPVGVYSTIPATSNSSLLLFQSTMHDGAHSERPDHRPVLMS